MKKLLIAGLLALVFGAAESQAAWGAGCGAAVVARQRVVVQRQRVVAVKQIAVKQSVVVEKVRVAQVVTPLVQVTEIRTAVPLVAPYYYGSPDSARLDRIERNLERLTEQQLKK